jgi:hypothetical protein
MYTYIHADRNLIGWLNINKIRLIGQFKMGGLNGHTQALALSDPYITCNVYKKYRHLPKYQEPLC